MDLEEVLKHPLTPVPPSLGNADGTFAKTDKVKEMNYILQWTCSQPLETENITDTLIIEEGNASLIKLFLCLTQLTLFVKTFWKDCPNFF